LYFIISISYVFAGQGTLLKTKIPAPSLANAILETPSEQPVAIYFPPSYETSKKRYPVVYILPGFTTDVTEYTDGISYQGLNIQESLDQLINQNTIKEFITVVVHGRNFMGGSFYVNSPVTGNWRDYVIKDVVGYVDKNYRTINNKSSRALAGNSMGGFGAFHIGMQHEDTFSSIYSVAPAMFDENGLDDHDFFSRFEKIRQHMKKLNEWKKLSNEAGEVAFREYIKTLSKSKKFDDFMEMLFWSYATAMVPNPANKVPYIDYPFSVVDRKLSTNDTVLKKYQAGFGAMNENIKRFEKNLKSMKSLTIHYGQNEGYKWIRRGALYASNRLHQHRIPHTLKSDKGGHADNYRERLEKDVFPTLSDALVYE